MAILRVTNEPSVDTSCACRLMLADTLTGPVIATRSRRIWMRPIWPFGAPSWALGCAFSHSSRENIVHSAFITLRFRRASNVLRRPSTRLTSFLRRGAHADRTQIARRSPFRAPFRAPRSIVSSEAIKGHQWPLVLGLVGETHLAIKGQSRQSRVISGPSYSVSLARRIWRCTKASTKLSRCNPISSCEIAIEIAARLRGKGQRAGGRRWGRGDACRVKSLR